MVTVNGNSYTLQNHKDLESILNHLTDYSVLCINEASRIFTGDADIPLTGGSVAVTLFKNRLVLQDEFMCWEFNPEKGWDALGMI